MKIAPGSALVLASHNPGKVRELAALVSSFDVRVLPASELGLPEPEETGSSFEDNALLKARAAAVGSGEHALADDSGLCVEALGGAPGIYSARWAGPGKDFGSAMKRIEKELAGVRVADRIAKFVCALSVAGPTGEACTFVGEVQGRLAFPPRGSRGFGYDPIFIASGCSETFGEMDPEEKDRISHRAMAFGKLLASGVLPA
ncbi:MAG: RdgB/HAM1 family non-canonical purine NTP pyrophosphatase [Alphaproteobacteria bacterium]|nr:RdgB/HAM1 family non-canonical purine NTP pyrophosphatase [Alphaproteobacteria bacterium]